MTRAIAASALLLATGALAWDSQGEVPGAEGVDAARHRLKRSDGTDEHRVIWLETLNRAGASGFETDFTLSSWTAGQSWQPVGFTATDTVTYRTHSPSEFSQLPDFSYSLWDWALGNETCPIGSPVAPERCHAFVGHMGASNSNHFPPQTKTSYLRYHELALGRAAECQAVRTAVGTRPDLERFVNACVSEALVLEAIGQHFLQDTWSAGHGWQRWGSPDESEFSDPATAIVVASFSGLIHGARSLLQPAAAAAGFDCNDAMNAPSPFVGWERSGASLPAVGDLYLSQLSDTGPYAEQRRGLFECAVGGVRAVLLAAGATLQPASVTERDPSLDPFCFANRVTNAAWVAGYALDFTHAPLPTVSIGLDNLAASTFVVGLPSFTALVEFEILRVGTLARLDAIADPFGTGLAEGGVGPMLGVAPNGSFNHLGAYIDPPLPWPGLMPASSPRPLALARQFHEAHAKDWCGLFKKGDPDFDLEKLRDRVGTTSGGTQTAACDVCAEMAERHVRIGDEQSYVPGANAEPLCGLIAANPGQVQYVYSADQRGTQTRHQRALEWCGCQRLQAAAGTFRNEAAMTTTTGLLVRLRDATNAVPTADVPFTVEGPTGWNGGGMSNQTYPKGFLRQFYAIAAPPVSGVYTVRAMVGGQLLTATSTVDASKVLAAPSMIAGDFSVPNQIGATWTGVTGAGSYLARMFDTTRARILTPVAFTTATSATLTGVPLNASDTNALQVWAFSNDMQPPDPVVPAQFNLSFDRLIAQPHIQISPGSVPSAVPGAMVTFTATVTGLSNTAVSWSTGSASGNQTTFTVPMAAGTYPVTATSVVNPLLHATSNVYVSGGGSVTCSIPQTAMKLSGSWRVVSGVGTNSMGRSCGHAPPFDAFMQGGTFVVSNPGGGASALVTPGGFPPVGGTFACGQSPQESDEINGPDVSLHTGTLIDPQEPDVLNGNLTLYKAPYLPCIAYFEAVR